jgi:hypothetical protein
LAISLSYITLPLHARRTTPRGLHIRRESVALPIIQRPYSIARPNPTRNTQINVRNGGCVAGAAAVQLSITASSDGNPFDVKDDANAALIDTLSGTYFIKPTNDPRAIPRWVGELRGRQTKLVLGV